MLCLCGCVPLDSVGELPAHNHTATISTDGEHSHKFNLYSDGSNPGMHRNMSANMGYACPAAGLHSHTLTIGDTGNGLAHNNMQPYLSCYMWRRIA